MTCDYDIICVSYLLQSSLPFALVEFMGWGTILLVTFISYGLLGIISNSAELEDPFGTGMLFTIYLFLYENVCRSSVIYVSYFAGRWRTDVNGDNDGQNRTECDLDKHTHGA